MTDDERAAVRAKAERLMILTTYPTTPERAVEMYEIAEAILAALAPHIPAVRNTWHAKSSNDTPCLRDIRRVSCGRMSRD
jgi:hypothetical protein